jgi:hypothetical protein
VGVGVAGIDLERAPVARHGAVRIAPYVMEIAEIDVRLRKRGIEAGSVLEGAGGSLEVAAPLVKHAQVVVAFCMRRIEVQQPPIAIGSRVRPGGFEAARALEERAHLGRVRTAARRAPRSATHRSAGRR